MPLEKPAYRDNLEQILKFSNGRNGLRPYEVAEFLGIDRRTASKLYPFKGGYISAATLARELS